MDSLNPLNDSHSSDPNISSSLSEAAQAQPKSKKVMKKSSKNVQSKIAQIWKTNNSSSNLPPEESKQAQPNPKPNRGKRTSKEIIHQVGQERRKKSKIDSSIDFSQTSQFISQSTTSVVLHGRRGSTEEEKKIMSKTASLWRSNSIVEKPLNPVSRNPQLRLLHLQQARKNNSHQLIYKLLKEFPQLFNSLNSYLTLKEQLKIILCSRVFLTFVQGLQLSFGVEDIDEKKPPKNKKEKKENPPLVVEESKIILNKKKIPKGKGIMKHYKDKHLLMNFWQPEIVAKRVYSKKDLEIISRNKNCPPSHLSQLSHNIHGVIFSFLGIPEILSLSCVCRSLRMNCEKQSIWKNILQQFTSSDSASSSMRISFISQNAILHNYFRGKYKTFDLRGHNRMITSIDVDGNKVISGSKDNSVKFWNLKTKATYSFDGHCNLITKVLIHHGLPISASGDRTIRIWSTNVEEPHSILKGHKATVNLLREVNENTLASASFDGTIKLWNIPHRKLLHSFEEHSGSISRLGANKTHLVSYSDEDSKIFIHNVETCQTLYKFSPFSQTQPSQANQPNQPAQPQNVSRMRGPRQDIGSLLLTDSNLLFTGESKKIKLWDLRKKLREADLEASIDQDPNLKPYSYLLPQTYTLATTARKIRFQEQLHTILGLFSCLHGIASFDIRKPSQILSLYDYHYYPVTCFEAGKNFNQHIGVSSGSTKILQYDLRIFDIRQPANPETNGAYLIPGHQASICSMKMNDGVIATGSKNGTLKILNFSTFSPEMKVLPQVTIFNAASSQSNRL